MYKIDDSTIKCTRGDKLIFDVKIPIKDEAGVITGYEKFFKDDKVIFSVKENFGNADVVIRKEVIVPEDTDTITFLLTKKDTTIGELISKPVTYQYDISINEDNTIIGYDDESGPKYFILYPEGSNDV